MAPLSYFSAGCRLAISRALPVVAFFALIPAVKGPVVDLPKPVPPVVPLSQRLQVAEAAAEKLPRLHSMLIDIDEELVLEKYFRKYAKGGANIKSASKSVISALIGIAVARGDISSVDVPIAQYFTSYLGPRSDAMKRKITVEDLLTMRSGLQPASGRNFGNWIASGNWVRDALRRPQLRPPGTRMAYSTANTHLLSALLTQASGDTTWNFARKHLARPLGFSLAKWPRDPQGIYRGGNDMELTPRQMLEFGRLYLNRGMVDGQRVLTEEWVEQTFVPRGRSRHSGQLYGYGWWIRESSGRDVFFAWGYGGQYIFVVPDARLLVVTTSSPYPGSARRGHNRAIHGIVDQLLVNLGGARITTSS